MFCLLGSEIEQHFDVAAPMSYRARREWIEPYEESIMTIGSRWNGVGF